MQKKIEFFGFRFMWISDFFTYIKKLSGKNTEKCIYTDNSQGHEDINQSFWLIVMVKDMIFILQKGQWEL